MPTSLGNSTYLLNSDPLAHSRHRDALVRLAQGERPGKAARGGLLAEEQREWLHRHVAKVAWPTLLPEEQGVHDADAKQGRTRPVESQGAPETQACAETRVKRSACLEMKFLQGFYRGSTKLQSLEPLASPELLQSLYSPIQLLQSLWSL